MRKTLFAASALALAIAAPLAHAHKAGDIIVRAGAVTVDPREESSGIKLGAADLGGKATLDSNTQLGLNFATWSPTRWVSNCWPPRPSPTPSGWLVRRPAWMRSTASWPKSATCRRP